MIHFLYIPALALVALLLASDALDRNAATSGSWAAALPGDDVLLRNFATVALQSEHEPDRARRITKWRAALRVHVSEEAPLPADARAFLGRHLERLGRLTGLAVRLVEDDEDANYRIVFTRRERFEGHIHAALAADRKSLTSRLAAANCAGMFRHDIETAEIVSATVVIPVAHARARGLLRRCIAEETSQVLGLPNDSTAVAASAFNDASAVGDLTRHDEFLLRLLYRPEMRPGLDRRAAIAVARKLIPAVRRAMRASKSALANRDAPKR